MNDQSNDWLDNNAHWIFPSLFLILAIGPLIFVGQCIAWLIYGSWLPLPIGEFFGINAANTAWLGLNQILDWLLDVPLAACVLALSMLIMFAVLELAER